MTCLYKSIARSQYTLPEILALLDIICSFAVNPIYLINTGLTTGVLDAYFYPGNPKQKDANLSRGGRRGEKDWVFFHPDLQASTMRNLLATVPNVIAANTHTCSWAALLALHKAIP